MTYNDLWIDVVMGLQTKGYSVVGGNDDSFMIMRTPDGLAIKVFLNDYKNTGNDDSNFVCTRFV